MILHRPQRSLLMTQLSCQTPVGQWVAEFPEVSRIFEELDIDYCCGGGKSLAEACRARSRDPLDVVLQLHQAIASGEPQETEDWATASLATLCDHIEATHHAWLRRELPRLSDMIAKVVRAHADRHPEMREVQQVFAELRGELEPHMMKEERVLFPAIRQMERAAQTPHFPFGSIANPIACMEHEHDDAGAALRRLRELTADYEPPADACTTYRVVLDTLARLEADMHQHVHKENNILFPRAMRMEKTQLASA
jgi:regulator of cell morphogenesis and NO signaling